ncbi:MAG: cysteine-rich CWC family protein [Pseudomonadota bacterium]
MSVCSRCGAVFSCGMVDGVASDPCWCTALPALPAAALAESPNSPEGFSCFCPDCLRVKITDLSRSPG